VNLIYKNKYRGFNLQSDFTDFMDFVHGMHFKYTTMLLGRSMLEDGG